MRGVRGILAGALALVALQTLVQTGASGRVGALLRLPGQAAKRFLDPRVPAIPDRAGQFNPRGYNVPTAGTAAGVAGVVTTIGGAQVLPGPGFYPSPWTPPTVAATGGGE